MPKVVIDSLRIEYLDAGVGLPLVFVPGLYGSAEWFRYQVSGLSDRYRVLSCSLRPARGRAQYSLNLLADDLLRFLDEMRIHSAVVIGHNLGAMVALKLAAIHPERVPAAVVVSATPSFAGISNEDIIEHLSPGEIEIDSFWTQLWKKIARKPPLHIDESDPLAHLRRHSAINYSTLNARLRLMRETDVTPILAEVQAPTLVVAGANDWSKILAGSQVIDQALSKSAIDVIENTDHFCFFTRHDLFNALLDDFVGREVPRL